MSTNLSIMPFGGVRENGKNMYAVTVGKDIYILDAGLNILKVIYWELTSSSLILVI
ncbi:Uncharacterised protein [Weissella viridescens]|uniref:Uncharacterized protein n=1 Tax=Weissella viridescens TaxID=1629 RepID=A0A380P1P0_WEIVI|nr:Uncharacterised protein [Weissella viridescens]